MRIVYLKSAVEDIAWMRRYYSAVFPEGAKNAREQLKTVERLIVDNPSIGERIGEAREFPIARTPFSVIYRQRLDVIEIIRVWDQRRDPVDLDH